MNLLQFTHQIIIVKTAITTGIGKMEITFKLDNQSLSLKWFNVICVFDGWGGVLFEAWLK